MYAEGEKRRRVLVVACDDRVAGRPARVKALGEFLDYASNHANVWFACKDGIARRMLAKEGHQ